MFRQLIAGAAAAVIALTGVKSGQYSPDEFYRAEGGVIVSPPCSGEWGSATICG